VFVEQLRIDFARKLLEETDVPLKTVAFRCGFHNATHMRMIFSRQLDTTPKQYRERFRADDVPRTAPAGETAPQSLPLGEAA
jgi:transcriptional regulator GlxA family with amidase domain